MVMVRLRQRESERKKRREREKEKKTDKMQDRSFKPRVMRISKRLFNMQFKLTADVQFCDKQIFNPIRADNV